MDDFSEWLDAEGKAAARQLAAVDRRSLGDREYRAGRLATLAQVAARLAGLDETAELEITRRWEAAPTREP